MNLKLIKSQTYIKFIPDEFLMWNACIKVNKNWNARMQLIHPFYISYKVINYRVKLAIFFTFYKRKYIYL